MMLCDFFWTLGVCYFSQRRKIRIPFSFVAPFLSSKNASPLATLLTKKEIGKWEVEKDERWTIIHLPDLSPQTVSHYSCIKWNGLREGGKLKCNKYFFWVSCVILLFLHFSTSTPSFQPKKHKTTPSQKILPLSFSLFWNEECWNETDDDNGDDDVVFGINVVGFNSEQHSFHPSSWKRFWWEKRQNIISFSFSSFSFPIVFSFFLTHPFLFFFSLSLPKKDNLNCTTENPCATLRHVISLATIGDSIFLSDASYRFFFFFFLILPDFSSPLIPIFYFFSGDGFHSLSFDPNFLYNISIICSGARIDLGEWERKW